MSGPPEGQGYMVQVMAGYPNGDVHTRAWIIPPEVAEQILKLIPAGAVKLIDAMASLDVVQDVDMSPMLACFVGEIDGL